MNDDEIYEANLLKGWEEIYKGGQLTLWVMLALYDGPKTTASIKRFIDDRTDGIIKVDDQSMYRSIRRYYKVELINNKLVPSERGPDAKEYYLTEIGTRVLRAFVERNIKKLYYTSINEQFIKGVSS